ncbi:MAG: hypothetical protein PVI17_07365 [Syntrophobacterales bacterium]
MEDFRFEMCDVECGKAWSMGHGAWGKQLAAGSGQQATWNSFDKTCRRVQVESLRASWQLALDTKH